MFCRFGSLLLNRPVAATAWLKRGVDASGLRVHELRQRVDVGALELLHAPPLEDQARQLVHQRQLLEDVGRRSTPRPSFRSSCRPAASASRTGPPTSCCGELMLNASPASSKIFALRARQLALQALRQAAEHPAVDLDAGALDVGEHRDERQFEFAEDAVELLGGQRRGQALPRAARADRRALRRSRGRPPAAGPRGPAPSRRGRAPPPR